MFIGWLIPIVIGTGNTFRQFCSRISFADFQFTLSFHDSECSRKPPMPIASVVMGNSKKKKTATIALNDY